MISSKMKKENLLLLIVTATVILTRAAVLIVPEKDLTFQGITIHHFWFGFPLIIASLILPKKYLPAKIFTLAIGLGLIIDQLIFILLGAGKDKEYWSIISTVSPIILLIVVYQLKNKLIKILK
jgi:hypothetical protein